MVGENGAAAAGNSPGDKVPENAMLFHESVHSIIRSGTVRLTALNLLTDSFWVLSHRRLNSTSSKCGGLGASWTLGLWGWRNIKGHETSGQWWSEYTSPPLILQSWPTFQRCFIQAYSKGILLYWLLNYTFCESQKQANPNNEVLPMCKIILKILINWNWKLRFQMGQVNSTPYRHNHWPQKSLSILHVHVLKYISAYSTCICMGS